MIQSMVIYVQMCSTVYYWYSKALLFFMLGVIKKPYLSQLIALGLRGISNINTQMLGGILSMLQIFIDSTLQKWKTGLGWFPHYCASTQMLFTKIIFDLVFLFFFNTFIHPVITNLFSHWKKYFIKSFLILSAIHSFYLYVSVPVSGCSVPGFIALSKTMKRERWCLQ